MKHLLYQYGAISLVFLSENISTTEKLYVLAHEVGHIFCGHLKDGTMRCSVEEEYEANEFAHMLCPPSFPSKVLRWSEKHKKPLLLVLLPYGGCISA